MLLTLKSGLICLDRLLYRYAVKVKLHVLLVENSLQNHASYGLVQASCKKQLLHCETHVYYPNVDSSMHGTWCHQLL